MEQDAPLFNSSQEPALTAVNVKMLAVRTPRHRREKALSDLLGVIKGVQVLNFKGFSFQSRVTTSTMILRMTITLNRLDLHTDAMNYDPWGLKWFPHASKIEDLVLIKVEVDGGDLYAAEICNRMRKLQLTEDATLGRQSVEEMEDSFKGNIVIQEEEEENRMNDHDCVAGFSLSQWDSIGLSIGFDNKN